MASRGEKLEDYGEAPAFASRAPTSEPALDTYEENDDAVTSFLEPPPVDPKWLVQVTALDRRSMSHARLRAELRNGLLVHGDTLVWRSGMQSWLPVLEITELAQEFTAYDRSTPSVRSRSVSTLPPRAARGLQAARLSSIPAARILSAPGSATGSVMAAAATSALVAAVTLALLGWGGAFESGDDQPQDPAPLVTPRGGTLPAE